MESVGTYNGMIVVSVMTIYDLKFHCWNNQSAITILQYNLSHE